MTTTASFKVERRDQVVRCANCAKRIKVGKRGIVRDRSGWISDDEIQDGPVFCSDACEWEERVL